MKTITIGTKADGTQVLLAGPAVDPSKQTATMNLEYKAQKFPVGIIHVEQWEVDRPKAIAIAINVVPKDQTKIKPKS